MSGKARSPLTQAFAGLMARLSPFESNPHIAIAVSGGADSMALCLLAHAWAEERGGSVLALTVDHGLREGSAQEARQVGAWLAARGIAHEVLPWEGDKPGRGVQAAAREARYRLLTERCRSLGILHLLLAHHREDQAETVLLRLARGSGVHGLAAMAPVVETGGVRLLRPLLDVPRSALVDILEEAGQPWSEDPSNQDPAFARVRMRQSTDLLAREGLTPARLAAVAESQGRARAALDRAVAELLVKAVGLSPFGHARVDGAALTRAPEEVGLRALARVLQCIGGANHSPRLDGLLRAYRELGTGRTLSGCRLLPGRDGLLVCRELSAVTEEKDMASGETFLWDRRFRVTAHGRARLAKLGAEGWRGLVAARPDIAKTTVPAVVRRTLPALWDGGGLAAVPHFGFSRFEAEAVFAPSASLT